jgi:hypothetical protein
VKFELNVLFDDGPNDLYVTVYSNKSELLGELRLPSFPGNRSDISRRERRDAIAGVILASLDAAALKATKEKT